MMYTPTFVMPGDAGAWPARIEAACRVIEEAFSVGLDKATPYQEGQAAIELADRPAFLKKKARTRTRWLNVCNGSSLAPTPSGYANLDYYALNGRSYANAALHLVSLGCARHARGTALGCGRRAGGASGAVHAGGDRQAQAPECLGRVPAMDL